MSKFPETLYVLGKDESMGVFKFGKSPKLAESDLTARVARIGGYCRAPDYSQSYLLAANTLLTTCYEANTLDHHGLPIFFLQRHAAELIIKAPLQFGIEIQDYRERLNKPRPDFPVDVKQRNRTRQSHDLKLLLCDLVIMADVLQVGSVPDALGKAIDEITEIEKQHTWSRYSFHLEGTSDNKRHVNHTDQEVVLPLGKIQNLLQAANRALGTVWPCNGLMMDSLGEQWMSLAREAGDIE